MLRLWQIILGICRVSEGDENGKLAAGNGWIFLLYGNAGSGVWFLYFSEKKKWILDQNGNQHRNSIPGKPVDLSILQILLMFIIGSGLFLFLDLL